MDGLSLETRILSAPEEIRAICTLLEEHKGSDVIALDVREIHSWTDYFIIATVSSGAHLQGLMRHVYDYARQQGISVFRSQKKNDDGGGWNFVDLGTAVIHLMTVQSREFYELEELWSSVERIYPSKTNS